MNYNSPTEITESLTAGAKVRVGAGSGKIIVKGIMAGAFIAIGASASSAASYGIANTGIAKSLAGVVFSIGLIMVVLMGAELFTGDCLLAMGVMSRKISVLEFVRMLVLVYLTNMAGAVLVAALVYFSGQLDMGSGALAAATIKTALSKVTKSTGELIASSIMCNVIVCAAVVLAAAAKDVAGKILGIFFAILAFVISGYEHCIANMYYIPAGLMAKANDEYREAAVVIYNLSGAELDALNLKAFFLDNLLAVTIGNIIGGVVLVAIPMFYLYGKKNKQE